MRKVIEREWSFLRRREVAREDRLEVGERSIRLRSVCLGRSKRDEKHQLDGTLRGDVFEKLELLRRVRELVIQQLAVNGAVERREIVEGPVALVDASRATIRLHGAFVLAAELLLVRRLDQHPDVLGLNPPRAPEKLRARREHGCVTPETRAASLAHAVYSDAFLGSVRSNASRSSPNFRRAASTFPSRLNR